jgi:DNA-directed RNA polymerase subunit E'
MFKILTIKDEVGVDPDKFNLEVKEGIKQSLQEHIEGKLNSEAGVFLSVMEVLEHGEGKIIPEDGSIYYPTEFKVMVFKPELHEVLHGEVVDITEFGAFTRIGPIDALIHVSQITDDKMSYDGKNAIFSTRAGKKLKEGDVVRARAVGVSLGKAKTKISLTMRQPHLGVIEWIEKEKKGVAKGGREKK